VKFYQYKNCCTCRKAQKFLDSQGAVYELIDIITQPPSEDELNIMLGYQRGELRKLFNTAGLQYRELGIKDRLGDMSIAEAIGLLAINGKLIKRPFLLAKSFGLVGYKQADWESLV